MERDVNALIRTLDLLVSAYGKTSNLEHQQRIFRLIDQTTVLILNEMYQDDEIILFPEESGLGDD